MESLIRAPANSFRSAKMAQWFGENGEKMSFGSATWPRATTGL